ncbi:hypothetical protein GBAR_LOCUS22721 [Geodia barretti]|uniref:Uncharacterized protein n=1 Tax=Geodia barretti TaxID=519541 RepID=A0AA35X0K0_GEOBA|nr:hypothetical protein GBAR_LOCUS22721 [Geodia barretti]
MVVVLWVQEVKWNRGRSLTNKKPQTVTRIFLEAGNVFATRRTDQAGIDAQCCALQDSSLHDMGVHRFVCT